MTTETETLVLGRALNVINAINLQIEFCVQRRQTVVLNVVTMCN